MIVINDKVQHRAMKGNYYGFNSRAHGTQKS